MSNHDPHANSEKPPDSAAPADERQISITVGASHTSTNWTDRRTLTFAELGNLLRAVRIGPKEGACYVPAIFRGGARKQDAADQIDIIVLDSDAGATLAEIAAGLRRKGLAGVIHSTASHLIAETKIACSAYDGWRKRSGTGEADESAPAQYLVTHKKYLTRVSDGAAIIGNTVDGKSYRISHQPVPKYRVVIPLATPWRASDYLTQIAANEAWKSRIPALAAELGLVHDESCVDTSRLFYFPSAPNDAAAAAFEHQIINGAWLNLADLPAQQPQDAPRARRAQRSADAPDAAPRAPPPSASAPDDDPGRFVASGTDLRQWITDQGSRFEVAKALRDRGNATFTARVGSGVKFHVTCPFDDEHTREGDGTGTFVVNSSERGRAAMPGLTNGFIWHCSHDSCVGRDRLDFTTKAVELGWLTIGDLSDPRFLQQPMGRPNRPAELFTLEEVRERLPVAIGAFWTDAARHHRHVASLTKSRATETKSTSISLPPLHLITPSPGTGKTREALRSIGDIIDVARAANRPVLYLTQSAGAARERLAEFQAMHGNSIKAVAFGGRGTPDFESGLQPAPTRCRRNEVARVVGEAEMSPGSALCDRCHHRGHADLRLRCGYFDQVTAVVDVIFAAHAYLFLGGVEKRFLRIPYAIIVDEDIVPAALDGASGERTIGLNDIEIEDVAWGDTARFLRLTAGVLRGIADGTMIGRRATVPVTALVDAGITAELAKDAFAALRHDEPPHLPTSTAVSNRDKEIIAAVDKARPAFTRARRQRDLAEMVHAAIDQDREYVPALRVERYRDDDGKERSRAVLAKRRSLPAELAGVPVLMLDATADRDQIDAVFGGARLVQQTHLECDTPHAWTRFVHWSGSDMKLAPDDAEPAPIKAAAITHRRELHDLIEWYAYMFRGQVRGRAPLQRNILVILSKKVKQALTGDFPNMPANVTVEHHGSLAGSNTFENFDLVLDISGMRIVPEMLEFAAEALHGACVHRLGYKDGSALPRWYPKVDAAIRMRGKPEGEMIRARRHPDARVEAFHRRKYAGEKLQNIHRLRPVNRTNLNRAVIVTVGDSVPEFEVDEYAGDWHANLPTDLDMLRAAGIVPAEEKGGVAMIHKLRGASRPKPWETEKAAQKWIQRHPRQVDIPIGSSEPAGLSSSYRNVHLSGSLPEIRLKLAGDRYSVPHWIDPPLLTNATVTVIASAPGAFDQALVQARVVVGERRIIAAIRATLEQRYGGRSMDKFELMNLPLQAASDALDAMLPRPGEEPTRESSAAFIIEAERLFAAIDLRDEVDRGELALAPGTSLPPLPTWLSEPLPAGNAPPAGRRYDASYRTAVGLVRVRYFPDASADGVWTDTWFNVIDPPHDDVRAKIVAEVASTETDG